MTLTAQTIQKRDAILAAAVQDGRLVQGSRAWLSYRDLFTVDPLLAERGIAQLAANPVAAARAGSADPTAPQSTEYDPAWLSAPERDRITRAHAGYPPVSHSYE